MLIHLVGDDIGVILLCQRGDELQLLPGKDLAAGVGGVAEDEGLDALTEGVLQLLGVEAEGGGLQGHIDGDGSGEDGIGSVIFIEGRENDHLVPGVHHRHHGGHHGLGTAAGGDDVPVRVDGQTHEAALFLSQRLPEVLSAPGDGVLVDVLPGNLGQTVEDLLRRVEVREALGQVHRAVFVGDAGHAADDGVGKGIGALGQGFHVLPSSNFFGSIVSENQSSVKVWMARRKSLPWRLALVSPTPGTFISSSMLSGRIFAMAVRVALENTT